jgi:hypothetical protein
MPYLNILLNPATGTSEADVAAVKLFKNFRPYLARGLSDASVASVRRLRSFSNAIAQSSAQLSAKMSFIQSFGNLLARATSIGRVRYLLNVVTVARPQAALSIATTPPLISQGAGYPGLNRHRITRGDLFPLWMVVEGQRLAPLTGLLRCKATDPVTGLVYEFQKSATLADPTTVNQQVERMSGRVEIAPIDTDGFPDRELEVRYIFRLSDGNGRVYTVEQGFFTVYPPLV